MNHIDDALLDEVLLQLERMFPGDDHNYVAALNISAEIESATAPGDPRKRIQSWRRQLATQ